MPEWRFFRVQSIGKGGKHGTSLQNTEAGSHILGRDTCILLLKRTDKQLDRLLTRLSECSCRKEIPPLKGITRKDCCGQGHQWLDAYGEGRVRSIYFQSMCIYHRYFCVLSTFIRDSGITSVAKGISRSWPCNPTDLIPYGADSFVESMLQWYRFVPDTIIFHITGLVLRICETLVIPSLVKYRFSHAVADSCRQLVDLTMADFTRVWTSLVACASRRDFSSAYRTTLRIFEMSSH
ncbi:hypothetical protein BJ912DRAFT_2935 [Pholiota molesta]|nr:hypothetical protein BJ912DRAFT_2935 [Pholiota molesta]